MKVFVTGATGFIGSATVKELLTGGHKVLGLARSEEAANRLKEAGAEVYYGDLSQPETLIDAVKSSDAVIHLGFIHDFSKFKEMCVLDGMVIETIGAALEGTEKPFIITSGIGVIQKEGIVTENDMPEGDAIPRILTERAADKVAAKGVHVAVMRFPPVVHDLGDKIGFIPSLISIAKAKGFSAFIDNGTNFWPAVHRKDAAKLFRLAVEKHSGSGTRYNGVAEQGIEFKKIAEIIGSKLGLPTRSIAASEVEEHFTWFAHFAKFNILASSTETQKTLNWQPTEIELLPELEGEVYFPA
ncbi:3-beta hydroxysteroid dehydrogenase [Chryseobacterium sp. T16E-39]|uniref:SDR family oxidoreductase n=1 Tax=Chryseobacterium sp. T16E-39 TaxID=2015076 RepID=UPI000B5B1B64|nr:SDR family oxidoreductase [Chryseobacterium sp. T16E-39]ASK28723.1 3-beta hydroxysteroid dehydrogenase [Chryseobacterium sp. T16E-39]